MIRSEREVAILRLLEDRQVVSLRELRDRLPAASAVTLRRDLARLEAQGRLRRTHGGAVRAAPPVPAGEADAPVDAADALILPPIGGRWAHTLRQHARRAGIPFFAESAPQEGGIYLGPDNHAAGRALGCFAGAALTGRRPGAEILLLSLEELPNTRERARGFAEGFRESFAGPVRTHLVDGRGTFNHAYRSALDALQAWPGIDVLFGVNDHSILAALEASDRLGLDRRAYAAYSVGGEGGSLFEELARDGPLQACAALFPEVVGRLAIDAICHCFAGGAIAGSVDTPFAILTPANLADHYLRDGEHWRLRPEVLERVTAARSWRTSPAAAGKSVGFILHYPAHEWYRNLAAAMRERAAERGVRFAARQAEDKYAQELALLRRQLARAAAGLVKDGETILLDGSRTAAVLARALVGRRGLTVLTNNLAVLDALGGAEGVRVILTGGEAAGGILVGPAVAAVLETMRVDRAFLSVDGVAAAFGLSCDDERAAEACRRFLAAAREVVVLADHSVVGLEARVRVAPLDRVDTVLTDLGTLPSHRLELASAGIRVLVADDEAARPQSAETNSAETQAA